MKTYEIKIKIEEGNDEFWEGLGDNPGVEEVLQGVRESVTAIFPGANVKLSKFEDKDA